MKRISTILMLLALATAAHASGTTSKQIDSINHSGGGSILAVPSAGSAIVSDSATQTLTNKSMSGSSNTFTNIPASAVSSGQLGVANGGTGASTLTQYGILMGNGTSAVSAIGPSSSSGYVLTSNGGSAAPTFQAVPGVMPAVNGGSASPQSVTAAGGVILSGIGYFNYAWLVGSPGAVVVTATPSITACTADGQKLVLEGTDATDTVTLQDQSSLSGSGLYLNGPVTLGAAQVVDLHCDMSLSAWVEDSRSN